MRTVRGIENLSGKKVLLRVDFNVPVLRQGFGGQAGDNVTIQEDYKIRAHKETINFLVRAGAKILLISHHSTDGFSFADIIDQLEDILDLRILFIKNLDQIEVLDKSESGTLVLMDNIRQYDGEEKNDPDFAKSLSTGFDVYVNDAFSVSHRAHTSVSAVTNLLPSYAGFLLEKETFQLSSVLNKPAQGKTLIIGGGKVGTKVPLVKNFIDKAENILIGGAVANNFFKAKGLEIGKSIFNENCIDELIPLLNNPALILPKDIVVSPDRIGKIEVNSLPVEILMHLIIFWTLAQKLQKVSPI